MDLAELNSHFGLPGVLVFRQLASGLIYAEVTGPGGSATVYLQGAHLAAWQPKGGLPVLFMSRKSDLEPGKPIRGGVPIAFPWFAIGHEGGPGEWAAGAFAWVCADRGVDDGVLGAGGRGCASDVHAGAYGDEQEHGVR